MSKEPELKARDKVVLRMKREGAVEENLTAGTEQRVSKRLEDAELVKPGETVWCCTIKVDIENSKGQYIEKDKQEATKDGSESTKIQHGI